MSNLTKYYIFQVIYSVGFMFCSGAILQTFLLQVGLSEQQVYLFNSFIQIMQVAMMVVMTFFTNRIKNVKNVMGISKLSLSVLAVVFLSGALFPSIRNNWYVIAIFIVSGLCYIGVGIYTILAYVLPYHIIDMKDYAKMVSVGAMLSGGASFVLSFVHTLIVAKFDYMQSSAWFFVLAIICFVMTSVICLSLKEKEDIMERKNSSKEDMVAVFKNKDTYILLLPNFARGIATGIMSVITVIAISTEILDEKTSSYVNIIMQVAMLGGNLLIALLVKKISSNTLLFISTIGGCIVLPLCIMKGMVWFLALFFIAYFFRMVMDTTIPIIVTEIIPKEQIGAYTSIRMLVVTGAQAIATLIITPIVGVVGYTGLLIFASIMLLICGLGYWGVSRLRNTNQIET